MTNCLLLSLADPATAGLKEGKKTPRESFLTLPRIQIFLNNVEFGKNLDSLSRPKAATPNRLTKSDRAKVSAASI